MIIVPPVRTRRRGSAGFTLLEVLVACGIFSLVAMATFQGLQRANLNAMLSRLQTGASTVAQNRIDLILSDGPFNPQKGQIPPSLATGVQTTGSAATPTVPIYVDPVTGLTIVAGWMTSTVAAMGTSFNGQALNLYRATVVVSYAFHGRNYSVTVSTLRTSDI